MQIGRTYAAVGALIGWTALALQYWLLWNNVRADGGTTLYAIAQFFCYFTILANLFVALVFSAVAIGVRGLRFFAQPPVQTAIAVYILIVMITYELLLRGVWKPQGLQLIVDTTLHDVMPVLYLVFWVVWVRKEGLRWMHPFIWLIFPALYLAYSLARGATIGFYPYPFIDVSKHGYEQVMINSAVLVVGFLIAAFAFIGLARFMAYRPKETAKP